MSSGELRSEELRNTIIALLSRLKTDSRSILTRYQAFESFESNLLEENRRLAGVVASFESQLSSEKSASNALRAKLTVLTQQLETKTQYVDSLLADERSRWESEVQRQQKVCETLQEELVKLKTATFEWEREKSASQREQASLQKKIETLTAALNTTSHEAQEWQQAFTKAQLQKSEFLSITAETMRQINDSSAKMKDLEVQEMNRKKRIAELEALLRERDIALSRSEAACVRMEGDKTVVEYELRRTRQQLEVCRSRLSELIRKRREEATALAAHYIAEDLDPNTNELHKLMSVAANEKSFVTNALDDTGISNLAQAPLNSARKAAAQPATGLNEVNIDIFDDFLDSDVEFEGIHLGSSNVKSEPLTAKPIEPPSETVTAAPSPPSSAIDAAPSSPPATSFEALPMASNFISPHQPLHATASDTFSSSTDADFEAQCPTIDSSSDLPVTSPSSASGAHREEISAAASPLHGLKRKIHEDACDKSPVNEITKKPKYQDKDIPVSMSPVDTAAAPSAAGAGAVVEASACSDGVNELQSSAHTAVANQESLTTHSNGVGYNASARASETLSDDTMCEKETSSLDSDDLPVAEAAITEAAIAAAGVVQETAGEKATDACSSPAHTCAAPSDDVTQAHVDIKLQEAPAASDPATIDITDVSAHTTQGEDTTTLVSTLEDALVSLWEPAALSPLPRLTATSIVTITQEPPSDGDVRIVLSDSGSSDDDMKVARQATANIAADDVFASKHDVTSQEIVVRDNSPPVRRATTLRGSRSRSSRANTRASLANAGAPSSGECMGVTGADEIPPLMNEDNMSQDLST